jgi:multiple sugar transport system ATP-binding protein
MADVVLDHLEKLYENGFKAVHDLSVDIHDGEFLVLVGPSGCGKSTALRMVAGLEDITGGELRIGNRRMNEVPARDRDIAMVFQSYALYPHMSVGENIAFGLKLRRMPKAEINARVARAAKMLGLEEVLDRRPKQLSGGQRQRVAMGRAIVREPQAFLMDEPLSNLDAKLRVQMRAEIARLQHDMKVTTIYVTHDQIEAMTMGDRVAVMSKGILQQVASPQTLYDNPDNLFVGSFIGSPPMNVVEAGVLPDGDGLTLQVGPQTLAVDSELLTERPALRSYAGKKVAVGVRSEDLGDASQAPDWPADRRLRTEVLLTEALGSEIVVHFGVDAPKVTPEGLDKTSESDQDVFGLEPGLTPFVASFSPRSRVRAGDTVEVTVDTSRLHFFDLATGLSIRA